MNKINKTVSNIPRNLISVLSIFFIISLTGCHLYVASIDTYRHASGQNVPRITIFDLQSKKELSIKRNWLFGSEKIIRIDEKKKTFQILHQEYMPSKSLILTTIDYNGQIVSKTKLPPIFDKFLARYSLSLEGRYFCYDKSNIESLCVYDLQTATETCLKGNTPVSFAFIGSKLHWISNTDFVSLISKNNTQSEYEIIKVNVNKNIETLSNIEKGFYPYVFFSNSNKFMAFSEQIDKSKIQIKVIECETGRLITIISGDHITELCWSPDDKNICYLDTKWGKIYIYSLDTNTFKTIKNLSPKYQHHKLMYLDSNKILYTEHDDDNRTWMNAHGNDYIRVIDIFNGEEQFRLGPFSRIDQIYVVDQGKKIIAETGY